MLIDCILSFFTYIIISIKSVIADFVFRPPNPPSINKYSYQIDYKAVEVIDDNNNKKEVFYIY
jgi:hypothetical protein